MTTETINLDFEDSGYGEDFETLLYAAQVFDFLPEEDFDLWFKAYDTSMCENEEETALYKNGYTFQCYVYFSPVGKIGKWELLEYPAKTREDAEAWLQNMANTIGENAEVAETVRQLVDKWSATRAA